MLATLREFRAKIAEINARYREPRIAMSLPVRVSLLSIPVGALHARFRPHGMRWERTEQ